MMQLCRGENGSNMVYHWGSPFNPQVILNDTTSLNLKASHPSLFRFRSVVRYYITITISSEIVPLLSMRRRSHHVVCRNDSVFVLRKFVEQTYLFSQVSDP